MTLRRPPALDRIVADMAVDKRESLLLEQLSSGKIRFWTCQRSPFGRTVLATAKRTSSIPLHLLGTVWRALRNLDEDRALELKKAS